MPVSSTANATASSASPGPSLRDQIRSVQADIAKVSAELQKLAHTAMDVKDQQRQAALLQARLQQLGAQLADLLRRQAERAAKRHGDAALAPQQALPGSGEATRPAGVIAVA